VGGLSLARWSSSARGLCLRPVAGSDGKRKRSVDRLTITLITIQGADPAALLRPSNTREGH
jgi:hypothetical protein